MMCVIQWSFFSSNEFYSLLELLLPYTYHISLPEITSTTAQAKKKKSTFRVYIEGSRKKQRLRKIGLSFFALTLDKANDEKPIIHHLNLVCVMLFSLDFCCLSFIRFIRCS